MNLPSPRTVFRALVPFALHGLAREVDGALGILLHSSLEVAHGPEALRLLAAAPAGLGLRLAAWTVAGLLVWLALAALSARADRASFAAAFEREAGAFAPLYLRPASSALALLCLAAAPLYPYASTLPVALTQDLGLGQDALALAWFVAARAPAIRVPAPGPGAVFFIAFLAYALLTPEWARRWEGHPGNEPKYLRQGVALAHELSFDAEGVSASMEELLPRPLGEAIARGVRVTAEETARLARATLEGPAGLGAGAIRATRITRQTIRGKEGGVYYVLAPGPSLLLAPTLRVDRVLNRARGTPGRLAVSVLAWNALGAALVAALFLLVRDATGRPGLAAALAAFFALTPPFLFYFFQFYPEMLGALVLALVFRALAFRPAWTSRAALGLGVAVAALPWLHQKFLPVSAALLATAAVVLWRRRAPRAAFVALVAPSLAGAFLFALYNFAITGSARPDALFLAWGPGGVTTARVGQGLLGLVLDARYGIVPMAPVYLLAATGLLLAVRERSPLLLALPAAAVYYATVAAADNWAGAVCNLGRYFMPVAPLAVAFVGLACRGLAVRRGALAVVLALLAWTGLFAAALWRDPHAANDSAVLLARSAIADAHAYLPGLFIRRWTDAAPGLAARVVVWAALAAGLAFWWRRGASPARAALALATAVLLAAGVLERWPARRTAPAFPGTVALDGGSVAFLSGAVQERDGTLVARSGLVEVLVRSAQPQARLGVLVGGTGVYRVGDAAYPARPAGAIVQLPLRTLVTLEQRDGRRETLARGALAVDGEVVIRFGGMEPELPGHGTR